MDLDSEELRKNALKLKLPRRSFRMLATIAEHDGDVVTYEELRVQFWPTVAIDNYKHSLGNSMLEIRKILDDSADNPHYIETVSRGYRFLVPVELIPRSSANGNGSGNSVTVGLQAEIQKIRLELPIALSWRDLALLLYRCEGLRDQHSGHSKLPDLLLLMACIKFAIERTAVLEANSTNPAISFETASRVFDDPNALSIPDPFVKGGWKTLGLAFDSQLLLVEHTGRRENDQQIVRIIRARRATLQERRFYEQTRK
jgi:hypothetical protein